MLFNQARNPQALSYSEIQRSAQKSQQARCRFALCETTVLPTHRLPEENHLSAAEGMKPRHAVALNCKPLHGARCDQPQSRRAPQHSTRRVLNLALSFALHMMFGEVRSIGFGPDLPVMTCINWGPHCLPSLP
ncbi:hypothetical protein GGQ99_005184 [Aminobacter niigataensis]|uniref:Uncharacterized protein n=1 Tax=Aminobacter niigataensis TaxID=83265 RepID=A0ABR6L9C8_9HYPH|nr:hypothetical protein [Aminobacter niigataensis]MBB4653393.1 hypothetical protein [Aminobacter niigataensis]